MNKNRIYATSLAKRCNLLVTLFLFFALMQTSGCAVHPTPSDRDLSMPGPCAEQMEKAKTLIWERRHKKALEILQDPSCPCARLKENLLLQGDIYFTLEEWKKAGEIFREVLRTDPRNPLARVRLWFADAMEKGFSDPVRDELKDTVLDYLKAHPKDPDVIYAAVLGLDGAKAVDEKTWVIEKYGHRVKDPSEREDLAEIYFYDTLSIQDNTLPHRAEFFRKQFPDNRYRYNMAQILLSTVSQEGEKAVLAATRHLLKKEPENRVLNYLCANAIVNIDGDLDSAEKYVHRAIRASEHPDPKDKYKYIDDSDWEKLMISTRAEYHALLGKIKFLQGDRDEAEKWLRKALALDPRCFSGHLVLARVLENRPDQDQALNHYQRALELKRSDEAVAGLTRILNGRGIYAEPNRYFAERKKVPFFSDMTTEAGLEGVEGKRVAWSDIDGNGFPDLFVNGRFLFINNGDGTFTNASEYAGITHDHSSGGILADFDKNGTPDLLAFTSEGGPRLYLNRSGPGNSIRFEDVTAKALPPWPDNSWPTEASAAADVDGDGAEDIYLADFEVRGPERGIGAPDLFYLNRGDGTFVDAASHIIPLSGENMCGRGAAFSDFNGDGRQDLFIANYRLDPDFLFENLEVDGASSFVLKDRADTLGVRGKNVTGAYGHSIGGAWGYLEDQRPALFVAGLAHPMLLGLSDTSALYLPKKNTDEFESHFEDMGFHYQETHSDPSFADVDMDGDLDLFITSVYRGAPSFLYLNQGREFVDATWLAGLRVENGWGAAWADYDRDGDMDLAVCSNNAPRLFRNEAQSLKRNWLEVKVAGTHSSTTGIGSKITVETADKTMRWIREIQAGRGTGNQDEAIAHFGLGKHTGPFKVTVNYPSGKEVVLNGVFPCRLIEAIEP